MTVADGAQRAWGWVEHLRAGGATPWADWLEDGADAAPPARVVPGAQNLALLRRLNLAAPGGLSPQLVEAVLSASPTGRGRPVYTVAGLGPHRHGPSPVDPDTLPDTELVRVAASVLADRLVPRAAELESPRLGWPRPWRRRYRLLGDPWLAAAARERLVALGRPPGGAGAIVLVLAGPLDRMLADTWTARATSRAAVTYERWLGQAGRGRLPVDSDPLATAETWAERVGRRRVQVVLDPSALPGLLGVRSLPTPPELGADAVELCRRVAIALGHRVDPATRRGLLRQVLMPRLAGLPAGERLGVPAPHRAWLTERAEAVRAGIESGGYAVVGDPAVLTALGPSTARPRGAGVLELAVGQVVAADRDLQGVS